MGVSDAGARSVARGVRPARSGEKRWFAAKGGCVTALTLLIAAPSLAAQGGGRADISGTVFDQGSAVVPGATVTAINQATNRIRTNNLFLVDGQYDNDSRLGGSQGTQARVTLDSMAEYQVQTHQYGAEYGGSTGVVVNAVTTSGSNRVSGRLFEYFQSNRLQATDYFLKQAGEENPESGSNVFGGSVGGPIVRSKLLYFTNWEYDRAHEAANLNFPAIAAPLATSYSTTTNFTGPNSFLRFDFGRRC